MIKQNNMKRIGIGIVVMAGLCLAAAFGAPPALATTNTYISQFNGSATTATSFLPYALAVNSTNGDVYVGDKQSDVVDEFNSTGTTLLAEFNGGKTASESFQPRSLAVNSSGDVYVGDYTHRVVDEFSPPTAGKSEPTPLAEFNGLGTGAGSFSPRSLAVNSSGDVYVGDTENNVVDEFSPPVAGKSEPTPLAEFNGGKTAKGSFNPFALAVNPTSGDVYVGDRENNVVDEFSPPVAGKSEPTPLGEITKWEINNITKSFASVAAVALAPGGDVYVADEGNRTVDRFKPKGASGNEQYEYEYECQVNGTASTEQCGGAASETPQKSFEPESLAVAPSGELYVGDIQNSVVDIFSSDVAVIEYPLTVKKSGTGKGTITSTPTGIECKSSETECTHKFPEEDVKLKESAAPGSTFTKWEDCTAESGGECEVTMSAAEEVKAEFTENTPVAFTPADAGTGAGAVKCEVDQDGGFVTCASEYGKGTELVIEGVEAAGSTFAGWSNGTGSAEACPSTGTCAFTIEAATTVTATFNQANSFPLNVYITGDGEVKGVTIACTPLGGVCEEQAKGPTTLTATVTPGSGYVLAGWIGCKKTGTRTCEVEMTQAREVTAVFLAEGTKGTNGSPGAPGESPTITEIGRGANCPAGGFEIVFQGHTEYLCNGKEGEVGVEGIEGLPGPEGKAGMLGEEGAAGANGATGSVGAQGPPGPAGPAGKEGPAGKVELVTCKKVGTKQKCTTKTVSGTLKFTTSALSAHATLSRHGAVYAIGSAARVRGNLSLRLLTVRRLSVGSYTLTLISGSGRHERIRSEAFMLR